MTTEAQERILKVLIEEGDIYFPFLERQLEQQGYRVSSDELREAIRELDINGQITATYCWAMSDVPGYLSSASLEPYKRSEYAEAELQYHEIVSWALSGVEDWLSELSRIPTLQAKARFITSRIEANEFLDENGAAEAAQQMNLIARKLER